MHRRASGSADVVLVFRESKDGAIYGLTATVPATPQKMTLNPAERSGS